MVGGDPSTADKIGLAAYVAGGSLAQQSAAVRKLALMASLPARRTLPIQLNKDTIAEPAGEALAQHDISQCSSSRVIVDLFVLARADAVLVNLSAVMQPMDAQLPMLAALAEVPVFGFNQPKHSSGWESVVCKAVFGVYVNIATMIKNLTLEGGGM